MSKDYSGKLRRHTYALADLKVKSKERACRLSGDLNKGLGSDLEDVEFNPIDWGGCDYEAWRKIQSGEVGLPLSCLPSKAMVISFSDLALDLAQDPRGYALLEGFDRNACGLESFLCVSWDRDIGSAFSFCVGGVTYTAFENPGDGYRSSMSVLIARDGNWCDTVFDPIALLPQFRRTSWNHWSEGDGDDPSNWKTVLPQDERAGHGDILELIDPSTKAVALEVGTSRSNDYYPSFVGYASQQALESAIKADIAESFELADELCEQLGVVPLEVPARKRRL